MGCSGQQTAAFRASNWAAPQVLATRSAGTFLAPSAAFALSGDRLGPNGPGGAIQAVVVPRRLSFTLYDGLRCARKPFLWRPQAGTARRLSGTDQPCKVPRQPVPCAPHFFFSYELTGECAVLTGRFASAQAMPRKNDNTHHLFQFAGSRI